MLHPDVVATLDIMLPGDPLSPEQQDAVNRGRALRPKFDESLGPNWRPQHPWLSQGSEVPAPMPGENNPTGSNDYYEHLGYDPTVPTGPSWVDHGGPKIPMEELREHLKPGLDASDPWWEEPWTPPLQDIGDPNWGQLPF